MKNPALWTKGDLHHHLQQAIDLEFWTIPLYLTALYSVKDLNKLQKKDYPSAALLIESVVIQEMLHLEIVCNICNALGYEPHFNPPHYHEKKSIPFIRPRYLPEDIKGFEVVPGGLNENSLKLFCAIEMPETRKEIVWNETHSYDCIAELYEGLQQGITQLWNECYVGHAHNTKQKISFKEYQGISGRHRGFSQEVDSPEAATKAIEAIIEQGEGADSKRVPADFRPPKVDPGKEFDPGWFKGELSHYQKFRVLLHHRKKLPEVHLIKPEYVQGKEQEELENNYRNFLNELELSFNSEGAEMKKSFWSSMFALTNSIIAVWETGGCPEFKI